MIIIGAGLTGLVAAHMLRAYRPVVFEAGPSVPNNHTALLRFRSPAISEITGIPMKKVRVTKGVMSRNGLVSSSATIRQSNFYSMLVADKLESRSIDNLSPVDRWIAPPDFSERLASSLPEASIAFGSRITTMIGEDREPIISTIPMAAAISMTNVPAGDLEFNSRAIWTVNADLLWPSCDLHQTVYFPEGINGADYLYRVSIVGNRMIAEGVGLRPDPTEAHILVEKISQLLFGTLPTFANVVVNTQPMGKIMPADDTLRRAAMHRMTEEYNVYSLGRFATWRPILLDDIVQDVKIIKTMIDNKYAQSLRKAKGSIA